MNQDLMVSHDIELGERTLHEITHSKGLFSIQSQDKANTEARDDQLVQGPVELILFEGQTLGYSPLQQEESMEGGSDTDLAKYTAWHKKLDASIIGHVDDLTIIEQWQAEQE